MDFVSNENHSSALTLSIHLFPIMLSTIKAYMPSFIDNIETISYTRHKLIEFCTENLPSESLQYHFGSAKPWIVCIFSSGVNPGDGLGKSNSVF